MSMETEGDNEKKRKLSREQRSGWGEIWASGKGLQKCLDKENVVAYMGRVFLGGNNSVVECNLAKVDVAGSNPVSRSNFTSLLFTNL